MVTNDLESNVTTHTVLIESESTQTYHTKETAKYWKTVGTIATEDHVQDEQKSGKIPGKWFVFFNIILTVSPEHCVGFGNTNTSSIKDQPSVRMLAVYDLHSRKHARLI